MAAKGAKRSKRSRGSRKTGKGPRTVAAADLGSNSFHMVVARWVRGRLQIVDKLRERVQIASGLDAKGRLSKSAANRAVACLERFGQRLRDMPRESVRAVGTNTLRKARNSREFLARAKRALGHPIEVISGREEARLVYQGVAQDLVDSRRRLVVDIGGGSTECIVGEGAEVLESDSLYMGCVSWSQQFFPRGMVTQESMDAARLAARLELEPITRRYKTRGWETAVGSSGTILAVERILVANGWSERFVTAKGLRTLRKTLEDGKDVERLDLPGLSEDRAPVLGGGVAVLSAVFDGLKIERMETSGSALREGLLYDLIGRIRQKDLRDHTIHQLQRRYHVDELQAERVEHTAMALYDAAAEPWELDDPALRKLLAWAARLHEIGFDLSRSGYHKHGAYMITNSDMPGFSREDQQTVGALVLGHRRRLQRRDFAALPASRARAALRLAILLRLAFRLNRSRSTQRPPRVQLVVDDAKLELRLPSGWLARNPLTRADLAEEAERLAALDVRLRFE